MALVPCRYCGGELKFGYQIADRDCPTIYFCKDCNKRNDIKAAVVGMTPTSVSVKLEEV